VFDFQALLSALPLLAFAARATIFVSACGLLIGFLVGVIIAAACLSAISPIRRAGQFYVFFFRGVPLLVLLMLAYYFLPFVGIDVPPLVAAIMVLALCSGAYLGEILRGGFLGIPQGQIEATELLGFSHFDTLIHIKIPQALKMTMPSLISETIMLVKASSLVSIVGIAEITRTAQKIVAGNFMPLEVYVAAGSMYMVVNAGLFLLGHFAERRLGRW
jgi:polar amino acid transport system permease protein